MSPTWENLPRDDGGGGGRGIPQFAMPTMTPVVKQLVIVNSAIFVLLFIGTFSTATRPGIESVLHWLGLTPATWKSLFPFPPLWQFLTCGFLHDNEGPIHVLFNMVILYFLGSMLEGMVGSRRFLVAYFGAMIAGGLLSLILRLSLGHDGPSVGASGAIMGVVVATAVLQPNARIVFIIVPLTLKVFAMLYVSIDFLYALKVLFDARTILTTDFFAHLGGAAFGFLTVKQGWIWRDPIALFEARRAVRHEQRKVDDQRKVDELLDRIHREGMGSLTERERAFLRRVSKRD